MGLIAALAMVAALLGAVAQGGDVVVRPADTGAALVNPDMGWTMHYYSNVPTNYGSQLEPSDTVDDFPGLSTVYLRVPWSYIQPEEDRFNWAILDTPAQRWIAKGKRVAFRITCSENWMPNPVPEWVYKAGAKSIRYEFGKGPQPNGAWTDPDFGDPVFLQKLEAFLAAMAARYDGNPNVAFMDVGTYGLWGEGHTFMSSMVPEAKAAVDVRKHIDLHVKHFPRTLLCISDDVAGHNRPGFHLPETDYALSKGVSLRDDSICVGGPPNSWYHADLAQAFWPTLPVILEHEHYGPSKERGAWGDGSLLLKSVEAYHASYMSIHWWPRVLLDANRAIIDAINKRMGYRLQLRQAEWPASVTAGKPFPAALTWANAGVAPCYPGGFGALTLKDEKGGIVSLLVDEGLDLRSLKPAEPGKAPETRRLFRASVGEVAPIVKPGRYDVFVSVGRRDGTPVIALPLANDDGARRYRLGAITVMAP
ncbi:MAG: DUF4832 domain-containing protein [Armatimonadetes bacterium]|nr:DUF4832 domain-containing protein [Armatimonadota bacterium]